MTAADQAPDPARPDAVQVPRPTLYDRGMGLFSRTDLHAYAEALAGQRVREERAAVVAWLRDREADAGIRLGVSAERARQIERGDHLDPS